MRYPLLQNNHCQGIPEVEDAFDPEGYGRWTCALDRLDHEGRSHNVLEVHKGCAWREAHVPAWHESSHPFSENKAVFRVSSYSVYQGVQLGDCVILNKDQMVQIRDMLNNLIQEIETNSALEEGA